MDLQFGQYRLKRAERQLLGPEGPVELSARSFDILALLLGSPDEVIGKNELFDAVWPGLVVEENTLQVHMSALRKALDAGMITTVHGRGYKFSGPRPAAAATTSVVREATDAAANQEAKPSIAVLPFENLSDDPSQQYFSDGITQDIIDRLTKFRFLSIIGNNSSFAFRSDNLNLREIRDKLKVDYVVTGNIRKSNNRIRISARLTEVSNETSIWAERYDRPLEDVFQVQDDVANIIASTLTGRVEIDIATRSPAASLSSLTSYENLLQGMWHFKKLTPVANAEAAAYFEKAIASFPKNAEAYRWLAACHVNAWLIDFTKQDLVDGLRQATRAMELDPTSAGCYAVSGFCKLWLEGVKAASVFYEKALSLNPGDPNVLIEAGLLNVYAGNFSVSRDFFDQAFNLNPLPPLWYPEFRAVGAFVDGRYAEAMPAFAAIPDSIYDNMYGMACAGHLSDYKQAAASKSRIHVDGRSWDLLAGAEAEPYIDPEPRERLITGLKMAMAL